MTSKNAKRDAGSTEWTVKDLERSLALRQALEVELDGTINQMEREIAEIRAKWGPLMAELTVNIEAESKRQGAWMVAHKADFEGPPRSMEFASATVGYRLGQDRLKLLSKWTWEKVLEKILDLGNEDLIRRSPEVDREVILANKDVLGVEGLKVLGLKIAQDDKPFIEIKRDNKAADLAAGGAL